ncbi:MAG: hypothetical protein FWG55_07395 [Candidatus Bathyarchaeota archaeon]|nr:hypothetical protein [Candidatus Termiticorpusculum sp.]
MNTHKIFQARAIVFFTLVYVAYLLFILPASWVIPFIPGFVYLGANFSIPIFFVLSAVFHWLSEKSKCKYEKLTGTPKVIKRNGLYRVAIGCFILSFALYIFSLVLIISQSQMQLITTIFYSVPVVLGVSAVCYWISDVNLNEEEEGKESYMEKEQSYVV